jgi:hypothetical protein
VNGDGIQCLRKWNVSWWKVFQFIIQLGTRIKKMQTHSCVRAISSCSLNSIRNLGGKNSSSRRGTVEILTICILIMEMRSRRCLFEYLENNYLKILGVQFEYRPPLILHSCERKNVFRGKLASWNLEFCNSRVVLLRNVQVPRRNSDSHLVFRDPTQLQAKKRI